MRVSTPTSFERLGESEAQDAEFVLVNMFRRPLRGPMRPVAVNNPTGFLDMAHMHPKGARTRRVMSCVDLAPSMSRTGSG